jgi:tight adherence protein B
MRSQILFAVLGAVVLLCASAVLALRADHLRESRKQRLRALVAAQPSWDESALSLRRPILRDTLRGFFLLTMASAWLKAAVAASGNRIGLPHLALSGLIATTAGVVFAAKIMGLNLAFVALLGIGAGVGASALLLRLAQSRYRSEFLDLFPDALDLMGRAVKAGLPVLDAIEVAAREISAPVGSELQRTIEEMRVGIDIDEAMQHTADRVRVPDFRFFVVALKLQRRTGGSLAETLANLSNIIRRRKEIRLKVRALSSESKSSAVVLALLPFVVGGIMFLINRDLVSVLFLDPRGRFMMGLAGLSVVAGVLTMTVIIQKSLR